MKVSVDLGRICCFMSEPSSDISWCNLVVQFLCVWKKVLDSSIARSEYHILAGQALGERSVDLVL